MITENKLLSAAIHDNKAFEVLQEHDVKYKLSDPAKKIWEFVQEYYDKDELATAIDKTILISRIKRKYVNETIFKTFEELVNDLKPVSVPNILEEVLSLKLENIAGDLSRAFSAKDYKEADKLLEDYNALRSGEQTLDDIISQATSAPVPEEITKDSLIQLAPKKLNNIIGGGIEKPAHIVVYARPNVGKTALLISMAKAFLDQGLKVLYLGNEDSQNMVARRMLSRLLNKETLTVSKYPKQAAKAAIENKNYNNFIFVNTEQGTKYEIHKHLEHYKPDILFVDQLRNISFKQENITQGYESLARHMRQLSKKRNMIVISAMQAGATAENKIILDMSDLDGSKTGVAGANELMLALGANEEMKLDGRLMLTVVRNKFNGVHKSVGCRIDTTKSKVY